MTPMALTPQQQAFLDTARTWYESLRSGKGTPLNQVPFIREQLANAGVEADMLDPKSEHTAAEIERELDQAYARAEQQRQDAWRDLAERSRPGPNPGRSTRCPGTAQRLHQAELPMTYPTLKIPPFRMRTRIYV